MDNWKNIRLELARTEAFPTGSVSRGYLIRLPLDELGSVDRIAFDRTPYLATVRRYWSSEPDEAGLVLGAVEGWAMRCDGKPDRLLRLDGQPFRLGDEVAVIDGDGTRLPFRIASIR
jgi:hypothetical protein